MTHLPKICSALSASRLMLVAGTCLVLAQSSLAQTWSGLSGVDSNWTSGVNWVGNVAPLNNGTANIIFGGSVRLAPQVNVSQDTNSITFSNTAGAFSLGGAGLLTIRAGGITNNDAQTQTINAGIVVAAPQTWSSAAGPITIGGVTSVQLNANLTLNSNFTISQTVGSNGAGSLIKNGTGTFALSGSLGHTGPTIINAGSISVLVNNALPSFSDMFVFSPGTLELNGNSSTVERLQGNGTVNLGVGTLVATSDPDTSNYTFSGTINGSGNYTKAGTFSQTLSGSNNYTGLTWVNNGILRIGDNERLSDASDLQISSGTFDLQGFTETVDQVSMTGGSLTGSGGPGSGTIIANNFSLNGGSVSARLAGNASLVKSNPSFNLFFTGTGSTYTGSTTITGGTLITNASDVLPDTTIVTVSAPGVLQVTNFPDIVAGISGNGTINVLNTTLSIGAGNTNSSFPGVIADSGFPGSITKIGSGSLTLSGSNTYTGTTTLNQGSITLAGAERLADASLLVINAGQFIVADERISQCTLNGGEIRATTIGNGTLRASFFNLNAGFVDASLASGGIIKATGGTVQLQGANDQAFTRIDAGLLQVTNDAAFGGPNASVSLNGGTLQLTAPMYLARPFYVFSPSTLDCMGDCIITNFSPNLLVSTLTKTGPGTLSLNGTPGTGGSLNITGGAVYLGPTASLPLNAMTVAAAGTLMNDAGLLRLSGNLSNFGRVQLQTGARITGGSLTNIGILSGTGTITSSFTNSTPGDVRIADGETILFSSSSPSSNAGLVEVIGGSVEFTSAVSNAISTGLIFARDATLRFNSGLTNNGSIASSFGTTDFFGDIDNRPSGVITISGASDATFIDDVINNGTLRTSSGGSTVFLGNVSGSGSFPGTGTVYLEGDLRPGNSPGLMTFGGDVVFGSFSNLVEEIAGANPAQFDRTSITGTASLDGSLEVTLLDGFIPSGTQSFTILSAGEIIGRFQSVNLPPTLPALRLIYTSNSVILTICAADYNFDEVVDFFDYLDFVADFAAGDARADFNDDTVIDFFDYLDFVQSFAAGC